MKILVLGGDGMLGHQLMLSLQNRHDIRVTLRQEEQIYAKWKIFKKHNSYFEVDVRREDDLVRVFADFQPEAVVNAVGIVKQRKDAKEAIPSIEINSLFPHRLAVMCEAAKARMIHMSTDCVFSGKKGNYIESDHSDAYDLYGKSKFLGEVYEAHCVTLRTSIIGLELLRKSSLIEWFLAQKGTIKGFKKAIYTGLTTIEMSRVIERILMMHPELSGVWQVTSDSAINKYDLLVMFSNMLGRKDIQIEADENFECDRSLNGNAFCHATGYKAPSWNEMLSELANQFIQQHANKEISCVV